MRKLTLLLALVAGLFISEARADFTAKDASAATITFKNPGACTSVVCVPVVQLYDGTNVVTLTTAGADAVSNTLTGLPVYGRTLVFNGTNWDRWQGNVKAASGSFASGALAAGALAAGAGVDGWDLSQGAIADSVVAAGATGSVSAKLRRLTTDLDAAKTSLSSIDTKASLALPAQANTTTNIGMVNVAAAANGGATPTGNIAANNTTAVVIKAAAGTLYGVQLAGIGSAPAYLKIYNATSATCGSGTPVKRLMIPAASTAANGAGSNITFGVAGVNFSTGITYCVTTGIGDSDTTAPAASTFLVNIDWQ